MPANRRSSPSRIINRIPDAEQPKRQEVIGIPGVELAGTIGRQGDCEYKIEGVALGE